MEWVVGQWVEWCDDAVRVLDMQPKCGLIGVDINGERRWVQEENVKPFIWQVGKTYRTTLDGVTATIKANDVGGVRGVCEGVRSFWDRKTGAIVGYADPENCPHLLPFLVDEPSEPEPTLTERYTVEQSGDGWLIRDHQDGRVALFLTQDAAEYAIGMIKDGDDEFCWRSDAQRAADKIEEWPDDKPIEPGEPEPTLTERYTVEHDGGPWWLLRDNQRGQVLPFATRELADHALTLAKSGEGLLGWQGDSQSQPQQPDPINTQHYRDHPSGIECIQVAEHMSYCIGNAIKYLWRAGKKGDAVEDLKKAAWYVNREIERLTKGGAE